MSAIDWTQIALSCGPLIGSIRRGVLKLSKLGFYLLFVPMSERDRVERDLAARGFSIHGHAVHKSEEREPVFVAVVKADNIDRLRAIAHVIGTGPSEN
jgi:hypothetical protein